MQRGRTRVKFNAYLRDMNVNVRAADERRIEVLAQDLPCFNGVQLDITLLGVMSKDGQPHPQAADVDGIVVDHARRDKEAKYPELVASGRCQLVALAIENGGRWSDEAADFVWQLAQARAREVPSSMSHSAAIAWERRWTRMLSISCAVAFTASLVDPAEHESWWACGGEPPSPAELLAHDPR